jgi:methyl-accepting chemotaxis protein
MGPLHRFRCTFEDLANGNLTCSVKIRKNDYLHTEEKALAGMIKSLTAKLAGLKDAAEEARTSLGRLEQAANGGKEWSETERNLLAVHRESLAQLASEFEFFLLHEEEKKQSA